MTTGARVTSGAFAALTLHLVLVGLLELGGGLMLVAGLGTRALDHRIARHFENTGIDESDLTLIAVGERC